MDDNREMPFGPPLKDDVTSKEYERAFKSLQEFLQLDPSIIKNIEDLSAHVSLVGGDIKKLVVGGGHLQETKFDYSHPDGSERKAIDQTWIIRNPIGDHSIFATASAKKAYVDAYKIIDGKQLSEFNFSLPIDDIRVSSDSFENVMNVFAVDWRGGKTVSYYPAKEPNNKQVQQGFVKVVQDGVRDILSVIDKPSDDASFDL